jgi:cytosine/adenosine deaminase-related metal-dependent hydrolase
MNQPLHIKNVRVWTEHGIEQRDLYTAERILSAPAPDAVVIDLDGYTLFPGLVNAHDHLELNHYPRTKFRERYDNAHQWGEDVSARLNDSPFKELRAYSLEDRLFIGGLKNLLCGATTVAHHNPPHKALFRKDFPVRVLQKYGWSHSLHFDSDEQVKASYAKTPKDVPWFIHLAEGTDEVAAGEYQRLEALGCDGPNTVIIHGVGIKTDDVFPAAWHRGLVWCPSTNLYLLGTAALSPDWVDWGDVAIGSDSRLTADGDLLDEIRAAYSLDPYLMSSEWFTSMAARIIACSDVGELKPQYHADFIALHTSENDVQTLCQSRRADLALVVKGGVPQIGDPDVMAKFPHIQTVPAMLDGKAKAIHVELARRLLECTLSEPGLDIDPEAAAHLSIRQRPKTFTALDGFKQLFGK